MARKVGGVADGVMRRRPGPLTREMRYAHALRSSPSAGKARAAAAGVPGTQTAAARVASAPRAHGAHDFADYDAEQDRIINAIFRGAHKTHANRLEVLAALETGAVETNFRNPGEAESDGSSAGWRQEINSYGPESLRRNPGAAAVRFFNEARGFRGQGLKPGALAQAVQRSAFPERYAGRREEALHILGDYKGGASYVPEGTGGAAGGAGRAPSISREQVGPGGTGVAALVQALMDRRDASHQVPSSSLTPPQLAAAPPLPAAYQEPVSGGAPAPPEQDLSDLLALVQPGQGIAESTVTPGSVGGGGRAGGGATSLGSGPGKLVGAPLDRAGVSTRPHVLNSVHAISAILGSPIQLGTGTAHDQYTTNGNVSDHWSGDAIDLPSSGKRLMAIGRAALIAAGVPRKKAMSMGPGLYNVNGWQIIFGTNSPALGGDHTDHVHVRSPRGYKWHG